MESITILANRLAESVLMDWDKEEQVRLAKEVAIKCHSIFNDKESREFVSLVKKMRQAQEGFCNATLADNIDEIDFWHIRMLELEREVDEYLKKMEE